MLKGNTPQLQLIAPAARTADFNTTGVSTGGFSGLVAFLKVTSVSGLTPTLDIKLQDSPNGTDWYDIGGGAFTQSTAATTKRLSVSGVGTFVRAVVDLGGTNPSFNFSLDIVGAN